MTNTPDILKKIIARKEQEVIECKKIISFDNMMKILPSLKRQGRSQTKCHYCRDQKSFTFKGRLT